MCFIFRILKTKVLFFLIIALVSISLVTTAQTFVGTRRTIKVVMDNDYAPYVFGSGKGDKGGGINPIFLLLAMVVVFYFFMIRPQTKKAKLQKQFLQNLQKGDKVVTIAGIHGTVNKVNEDGTMMLEINPGSYIKIEKKRY